MSPIRSTSLGLSLVSGVCGIFVALLAASRVTDGPSSSSWVPLCLGLAALMCGVGVLGGLLVPFAPAWLGAAVGTALLLGAAAGYGVALVQMVGAAQPSSAANVLSLAGPVAGLFLGSAVLGDLARLRPEAEA